MASSSDTRPLIRVGHKGADHVAPGNTAESFEAALDLGVDMIEFDVLPLRDGTLVLAHDPDDATARIPMTLEEGLDHFAAEAYNGVELDVDLKIPGYERDVVEGLRERGLLERSLISSTYPESLTLVRQLDPDVRRGLSVPRVRRDLRDHPVFKYAAYGAVAWWRSGLPAKAERALRRGHCEALMSHYVLVTRELVKRIKRSGGQLYVWTVDDAAQIARLEALGVDGVISNDPRLFGPSRSPYGA